MELGWVHPRLWEEAVVLRELLLEAFQMHAECALATNVVHAEEVVGTL